VYAGAGGTTKAYLGYGVQIAKGLSIGTNISYLFGTLESISSLEVPGDIGALNIRTDNSQHINGFSFDYGVQFYKPLSDKTSLTPGYTGTAGPSLNTRASRVVTRTPTSAADDAENIPVDSISTYEGSNQRIKMPLKHSLGFSVAKGNNWMVGGDVNYAK